MCIISAWPRYKTLGLGSGCSEHHKQIISIEMQRWTCLGHDMETLPALLALCEGNTTISGIICLSALGRLWSMYRQEWRCSWSSADRRCSNYIWVIDNFIAYYGAPYIRGFMVDVIACHLFSANPLPESVMNYCKKGSFPVEHASVKSNQNTMINYRENAFKIAVCKWMVIFFRSQCDNSVLQSNCSANGTKSCRQHIKFFLSYLIIWDFRIKYIYI